MIRDGHDPEALQAAVQALAAGQLLGLPTETVYGLAADACQDAAVAKVYAAKGRPPDHPLIVHVADAAQVPHFAREVPAFAQRLMQAFWPGPLTLILPRRAGVAQASAAGQDSIGLRCPSHPVAQALLRACAAAGMPGLSAPSANRFGRVSPTRARHVQDELGPELLVLDGGTCEVGIESAIVDCSRLGATCLRHPGLALRAARQGAADGRRAHPHAPGGAGPACAKPGRVEPRATGRSWRGRALARTAGPRRPDGARVVCAAARL
jgi:L-threonylcarbamoyladenylate synthase